MELEKYMLPCLNKKLFGIDCPGCGIQRSLAALIEGNFTEAFNLYPAVFTLLALFVFFLAHKKFQFKAGKEIIIILVSTNLTIVILSYIIKMNQLILIH